MTVAHERELLTVSSSLVPTALCSESAPVPFARGLEMSGTLDRPCGAFPFVWGTRCDELVRDVGTGGAGALLVTTILVHTWYNVDFRGPARFHAMKRVSVNQENSI